LIHHPSPNQPSTIDEISDYLFANSTADSHFIDKFRQNIHCALNKLKQRNIIKQDQHTYEIA